jgi:hypothetical protein
MKAKDALDAIEQLEFMARQGRRLIKDTHPDAEVGIRGDSSEHALIYFLEFIWGMNPGVKP